MRAPISEKEQARRRSDADAAMAEAIAKHPKRWGLRFMDRQFVVYQPTRGEACDLFVRELTKLYGEGAAVWLKDHLGEVTELQPETSLTVIDNRRAPGA